MVRVRVDEKIEECGRCNKRWMEGSRIAVDLRRVKIHRVDSVRDGRAVSRKKFRRIKEIEILRGKECRPRETRCTISIDFSLRSLLYRYVVRRGTSITVVTSSIERALTFDRLFRRSTVSRGGKMK